MNPFFSPNGEWVGFWADRELRKVALAGGLPVPLCESNLISGASWGEDDRIVFASHPWRERGRGFDSSASGAGLWSVSSQGGPPQPVTEPQPGFEHRHPWLLHGGAILFTDLPPGADWEKANVVVQAPGTREQRVLVQGAANPIYAPSGHLLFVRAGVLWAAPFDASSLRITGPETPVLEGVTQALGLYQIYWDSGVAQLSLSASGTLVYLPGGLVTPEARRVVWVDRDGRVVPLDLPESTYWLPRVSPDGRRVAITDNVLGRILVVDLERRVVQPLPGGDARNVGAWTTDGARVVFERSGAASPVNLFWQPVDGSGPAEQIGTGPYLQFVGPASRSGELIYVEERPDTSSDLLSIDPLAPEQGPKTIVAGPTADAYPALSPDERWLAYASDESGRYEVYVVTYPDATSKQQVSTGGGYMPAWSPDGRELFYIRRAADDEGEDWVMRVPVSGDRTLQAGQPRELFPFPFQHASYTRSYDVAPDGRFLMVERGTGPQARTDVQPRLIFNWLAELERQVPAAGNR